MKVQTFLKTKGFCIKRGLFHYFTLLNKTYSFIPRQTNIPNIGFQKMLDFWGKYRTLNGILEESQKKETSCPIQSGGVIGVPKNKIIYCSGLTIYGWKKKVFELTRAEIRVFFHTEIQMLFVQHLDSALIKYLLPRIYFYFLIKTYIFHHINGSCTLSCPNGNHFLPLFLGGPTGSICWLARLL